MFGSKVTEGLYVCVKQLVDFVLNIMLCFLGEKKTIKKNVNRYSSYERYEKNCLYESIYSLLRMGSLYRSCSYLNDVCFRYWGS